ncbi:MAG: helix-turn-helix transcriptional regulator [Peptococcaceae bacterium]|nr:helix-turn-helix transcriptional regulator [Peptococcaceae bacterium]
MSNILSIRLRMAREAKHLTQVQVKKLTNINNKTLSGYEKGVSEPDVDTLITLANLYETSVDYLVGNIDEPTPHFLKKEKPNYKKYILSAPTLEDAACRIAELKNKYYIDRETYLTLSEMAYDKHNTLQAKGTTEKNDRLKK